MSKEEDSDGVSGPWLTDWGTTKVDSTERGDNKLTKQKKEKTK